jgi:hypothetical protein
MAPKTYGTGTTLEARPVALETKTMREVLTEPLPKRRWVEPQEETKRPFSPVTELPVHRRGSLRGACRSLLAAGDFQNAGHPGELRFEGSPTGGLDPVHATPSRVDRLHIGDLGNKTAALETLQRLIEASRAEQKTPSDPFLYVELDRIAMSIAVKKR